MLKELASEQLLERVTDAAEREIPFCDMVKNKQAADEAGIIVRRRAFGGVHPFRQPAPGVQDGLGIRMRFKLFHRNVRQTLR